MTVNKWLLDVLACPECKTRVTLEGDHVLCAQCHRQFPIRDGIPIMLISEATQGQTGQTSSDESPTSE